MPDASARDDTARMMRYDAGKKSAGVAYLLWFILGMLGVHRFYLGRSATGVVILVLTASSVLTMGFTLIISGVWILVDLFLIPGLVREQNELLIRQLS